MGNRSAKDNEQLKSFTSKYKVVQQDNIRSISLLEEKSNGRQCLLKETTFNDKEEFAKALARIKQKKQALAGEEHIAELLQYLTISEDHFCSNFHKIYALYDYPHKTLSEELKERQDCHRRFQQSELWSILASCILALSHLQNHSMAHQSIRSSLILLTSEGIVKLSDPECTNQVANYTSLATKLNTPHVYPSPQQCQSLCGDEQPYNPFKTDVFSLGMVMLEAGLLAHQDDCYRHGKINWEAISYSLERFGDLYSLELRSMVELMLEKEEADRPGWGELVQYVKTEDGDAIPDTPRKEEQAGPQQNRQAQLKKQEHLSQQQSGVPEVRPPPVAYVNQNQNNAGVSSLVHRLGGGSINQSVPPRQSSGNTSYPNPSQNTSSTGKRPQPPTGITRAVPLPPEINLVAPSQLQPPPFRAPLPANSYQTLTSVDQNLVEVDAEDLTITRQPDQVRNGFPVNPNGRYGTAINSVIQNHWVGQANQNAVNTAIQNDTAQQFRGSVQNIAQQADVPIQNSSMNNVVQSQYVPYTNSTINLPTFSAPYHSNYPQYKPSPNTVVAGTMQNMPITIGSPSAGAIPPVYVPLGSSTAYQPSTIKPYDMGFSMQKPVHKLETNADSEVQYVKETFKQGSKYEGEKVSGMRHGKGKFYYQDGGMYDGDWKYNKMEGHGKLYYQSGKIAYDGHWKDDQFKGYGILYNQYPVPLNQSFDFTNLDLIDEYWTKFQGQFIDDLKQGQGRLYLSNGQYFQGDFDRDAATGEGKFYRINGQVINGIWNQNQLQTKFN